MDEAKNDWQSEPDPFEQVGHQYALDISSGKIPACKLVIGAVDRHLGDLERFEETGEYLFNPWMLDKDGNAYRPIEKICKFAENLPHIKGKWAGTNLTLEPWQIFFLGVVFGWIIAASGYRRFRTAYLEVPRKNGKTFLMSIIGLYLLLADGEGGAEVYSAAVTREQARLCFDTARRMVVKTKPLQEKFGVEALRHSIFVEDNDAKFQPVASDADSLDGLNVHAALVDELHSHKTRAVWDVMETACGSRENSLQLAITTAGSNQAGICFEQREYTKKLISGTLTDESYFGIIYTVDDADIKLIWGGEDFEDIEQARGIWEKANPNYGVSVLPFDMERLVRKAKQSPSSMNNVLTKRFNVWVSADVAWLDMWRWNSCHDPDLKIEDFAGEECIIGSDFASKSDIAATCWLFHRNGIYYPFLKYYLPQEVIDSGENDLYSGWWREGLLTATPGEIIDFDYIESDILASASKYQIREYGYDPFQATQHATRMIDKNLPMVEVRPGWQNYSEPMKEIEALTLSKGIRHNDPILAWMVSNTVCKVGNFETYQPRKTANENKIDGVIALLTALNRWIQPNDAPSPYESRGLRVV